MTDQEINYYARVIHGERDGDKIVAVLNEVIAKAKAEVIDKVADKKVASKTK